MLQKLCLHAHAFTSFVSIEPPNALLLEIKGSVKLFGSLEQLHADIDACWRRLGAARLYSATAPSTLAALWLARAGHREAPLQIEDTGAAAWPSGEGAHRLHGMGYRAAANIARHGRHALRANCCVCRAPAWRAD